MGLFGDKNLKALDREIMAMKLALTLRDQARDPNHLERGLKQGTTDITNLIKKLMLSGKGAEARAMLGTVGPRNMPAAAQEAFAKIRAEIDGRLD